MKRYLRLDIEYETDDNYEFDGKYIHALKNNIARILAKDMPYVTIIFSMDTPIIEDLDRKKSKN